MIEVSALLFTLLAEGAAVLSLILIIWIVISIRKGNKDKAAAQELVGRIKKNSENRLAAIEGYLSQTSGLDADELALSIKKLDRSEKDFFTQLIRLYIRRDAQLLVAMDEQLDKVIGDYKSFAGESSDFNQESELTIELNEKIDNLTKEKKALKEELDITNSTMASMMSEFSALYKGGGDPLAMDKKAVENHIYDDSTTVSSDDQQDDDIQIETQISSNDDVLLSEDKPSDTAPDAEADDDVFFSSEEETSEATAPESLSHKEDNFGDIVSSQDVDDLLDGIDLSKEIDMK